MKKLLYDATTQQPELHGLMIVFPNTMNNTSQVIFIWFLVKNIDDIRIVTVMYCTDISTIFSELQRVWILTGCVQIDTKEAKVKAVLIFFHWRTITTLWYIISRLWNNNHSIFTVPVIWGVWTILTDFDRSVHLGFIMHSSVLCNFSFDSHFICFLFQNLWFYFIILFVCFFTSSCFMRKISIFCRTWRFTVPYYICPRTVYLHIKHFRELPVKVNSNLVSVDWHGPDRFFAVHGCSKHWIKWSSCSTMQRRETASYGALQFINRSVKKVFASHVTTRVKVNLDSVNAASVIYCSHHVTLFRTLKTIRWSTDFEY